MLTATTLKKASIISAAAGQLRRALPLFAASVLTRFDLKVTLNWISLSDIYQTLVTAHSRGCAAVISILDCRRLGIQVVPRRQTLSGPSMYVPSSVPAAYGAKIVWQSIVSRTWTDHNSNMWRHRMTLLSNT